MADKTNSGDEPLYNLYKRHPQIKEKAIFDYVNGIEILGDQLRLRSQINSSFFARIWSSITGQTAQRQQLIDRNITVSLNSFSICLQDLQLAQAESDLSIANLANKLIETREGIMLLKERQQSLLDEVFNFQIKVKDQFAELEYQILHTEKGLLGYVHLEQVFDKWEAGRLDNYPPLVRLFLAIDELYWGNFGTFCRISHKREEIQKLCEQFKNKVLVQMKRDLDVEINKIILFQKWLSPIQSLPEDLREVLIYLSDWAQPKTTPVIWAMRNAALPKTYFPKSQENYPRVLSGQQVINYLIHENKKRQEK